jgi:magnesium transporter
VEVTAPSLDPLGHRPAEWSLVVTSTLEEAEQALVELGVPAEFAEHALDAHEQPRMESSAGSTLVVLQVPVFHGEKLNEPWVTQPFGLVLTHSRVVAISSTALPILDAISRYAAAEARHPARLLLHSLQLVSQMYLRDVRRINRVVDRLEDRLRASMGNREVLELLKCQKAFVYFANALRSTEHLLERLQKSGLLHAAPEDSELLEDVRVDVRQALEMTQTSADILSQMMDAFASMISNNLNVVMKFLAAITVILMIPTLIASFYGMNVALPLAGKPWAFAALVAASLAGCLAVAFAFVKRRWI